MSRVVVTDYTFPTWRRNRRRPGPILRRISAGRPRMWRRRWRAAQVAVVQFAPFGPAAAAAMQAGRDGDPLWRGL